MQWHPTILSKLALVPQDLINSYSTDGGSLYEAEDMVARTLPVAPSPRPTNAPPNPASTRSNGEPPSKSPHETFSTMKSSFIFLISGGFDHLVTVIRNESPVLFLR